MKDLGWSESEENSFLKYNKDIFKNNRGTFQIQKRNGIWYWFFKLSSGTNRLQYLCKCYDDSNTRNTSFERATDTLKKKIKLSFKGTRIGVTNLSEYIDEYIDFYLIVEVSKNKQEPKVELFIMYG